MPPTTWLAYGPFLALVLVPPALPQGRAALTLTGVNLAGAEFGQTSLPGTYGTHYIYPTAGEVDYFVGQGMNVLRLPFRWERLQRSPNAPLDATERSRMDAFVQYATEQGAYVVLDPHNFARYYPDPSNYQSSNQGLIGGQVPHASFADFWSRLSLEYKDNPRVIFNLMNEPNSMPTEQWVSAANAAIAAIRATGAENLILVPGNGWTGAWTWQQSWYGTPNAVAMLDIVDPGDNFAYDVHQYLDSDGSGTSASIVRPTIGSERLAGFTQWLRTHQRRAFLGEWAVAGSMIGPSPSQIGDEAMEDLLLHLEANRDVWLGWAWWAAGPWWGNYMFSLEPTSGGADRPQMAVLEPHLAGMIDLRCDFDQDLVCGLEDLNTLLSLGPLNTGVPVVPGVHDRFDLDQDAVLSLGDVHAWLDLAAAANGLGAPFLPGDADLSGAVDASDFNLWNAHKFSSSLRWDQGDFNADGAVDASDFNIWNGHKFQSSLRGATVPECITVWQLVALGALFRTRILQMLFPGRRDGISRQPAPPRGHPR